MPLLASLLILSVTAAAAAPTCDRDATTRTVRCTFDLRDWVVDYARPTVALPGKAARKQPWEIPTANRKAALLINDSYPGPLIEAFENDTIVVNVLNNMLSEAITIHWHGLHMPGTPFMDGVRDVTQAPVAPGANFTYRFPAWPPGSHFYHAHMEALQADRGLKGPIVIHEAVNPYKDMYQEDKLIVMADEWQNPEVCLKLEGALPGNPVCSEIDKASYNGQWGDGSAEYPYPLVTIEQGKCYRMRFIAMMGQTQNFQMTVAGHNLTIIALDGYHVQPYQVSQFNLHAGERVDAILCADQAPGNYLITATYDLACFLVKGAMGPVSPTWWKMGQIDACSFYSFLNYKGHTDVPQAPSKKGKPPSGTGGGSNPIAPTGPKWDTNLREGWTAMKPLNPEPEPEKADKTYVINVGVKGNPDYTDPTQVYQSSDRMYMFTKVQPWERPTTPLLHTKGQCGAEGTPVLQIPENVTTVELIINNLSPTAHVLHMHGMRFKVINYADFSSTWCSSSRVDCFFTPKSVAEVHCPGDVLPGDPNVPDLFHGTYWGCRYNAAKDEQHRNLQAPLEKDMVSLWRRSWTVIRFKATNPGVWLFHCHMEQHIPTGQLMALNVKPSKQPPIPPEIPRSGDCPVWSDVEVVELD